MCKFTPAPWVILGPFDSGFARICTSDSPPYRDIAQVFSPRGKPSSREVHEEIISNANLIAAAPDLLEALEELIDVQNGPPLITYTEAWNEAMAKANAAIIKARHKESCPCGR